MNWITFFYNVFKKGTISYTPLIGGILIVAATIFNIKNVLVYSIFYRFWMYSLAFHNKYLFAYTVA